jgi:hypothetical protein
MDEPGLNFFDVEEIVRNLNSQLSDPSDMVHLGEVRNKKPKRFSISRLLDKLRNTEIQEKRKYTLSRPYELAIFHPFSDVEKIGHIILERGYTDTGSDYGGCYEEIQLRIMRALKLKKGKIIPECRVMLTQEAEDGVHILPKRADYVRDGMYWRAADLSGIVLSEWFFKTAKVGRY